MHSIYPADNFFLYIPDTKLFMTPVGCRASEREDICRSIDEAEHVENYVALSNIRYHDSLELDMKVDPSLLQCKVIPLILLNFVENTIKYEVRIHQKVVTHIAALPAGPEDEPQIAIQIGIRAEGSAIMCLKLLVIWKAIAEGHVGIGNVYKRAKLQLGWCRMAFCNRPGAGAQRDILLPQMSF